MLLSIIIPTKNRKRTLEPVVKSILDNINGDYEIVIQDNSDDGDYLDKSIASNSKVRYFHSSVSIPISDNTEKAIENSIGEYILFIGDDDFVNPNVMRFVSNMKKSGIKNLTYSAGYYWWDTVNFHKKDFYHDNKNLWVPKNISEVINIKNTKSEVNSFCLRGGVSIGGLPRVYHGITERKTLDIIKDKAGNLVVGSCPDISLALSLSMVIDEFHFVNYPLTVYGASSGSGGGMTASKKHFAKIEEMPWLRPEITDVWSKQIPRFWSERTIYPQTATEVFDRFNAKYEIDFSQMFAALLCYEPHLKNEWIKSLKGENKNLNTARFKVLVIKKVIGQIIYKCKLAFKFLPFKVVAIVDVDSVSAKLNKC